MDGGWWCSRRPVVGSSFVFILFPPFDSSVLSISHVVQHRWPAAVGCRVWYCRNRLRLWLAGDRETSNYFIVSGASLVLFGLAYPCTSTIFCHTFSLHMLCTSFRAAGGGGDGTQPGLVVGVRLLFLVSSVPCDLFTRESVLVVDVDLGSETDVEQREKEQQPLWQGAASLVYADISWLFVGGISVAVYGVGRWWDLHTVELSAFFGRWLRRGVLSNTCFRLHAVQLR
ncbi:unnamed protein product [Ectocarpus fasciculatus]